jgi:endonuclease YncB( thermonuclease family)
VRRSRWIILALAGLAIALSFWPKDDKGPAVIGTATVVDGDTLRIGGETFRLQGIDAPELAQTCGAWPAGEEARRALVRLIDKQGVRCERTGTDRYGRTTAHCYAGETDLGAALVRSGMAFAYTTYSVRYLFDEVRARVDGVGIHGRGCVDPADWRAAHPR